MLHPWIAQRTTTFDSSGIRKVFDLAAQMKDPINLSIGQPDFDVPEAVRQACIDAIQSRKNGYALTQGMPVLREKLQQQVDAEFGHADRKVFVSSGTSGGLVLAMLSLVNPGDEVIIFDPFFVMYQPLVSLVGGTSVLIDTYPDFRIDLNRVADAITPKTKLILLNSPANPTGVTATAGGDRRLGQAGGGTQRGAAVRRDLPRVLLRRAVPVAGQVQRPDHRDRRVLQEPRHDRLAAGLRPRPGGGDRHDGQAAAVHVRLRPQPVQWAGAVALDVDVSQYIDQYRRKRDMIYEGLADVFELVKPGGAFYAFPKAPWGSGTEFVAEAIRNQLLIIPGGIFSQRDTHFRLSYAADDTVIERGIEVLRKLAKR